jgi:hypothetical protein
MFHVETKIEYCCRVKRGAAAGQVPRAGRSTRWLRAERLRRQGLAATGTEGVEDPARAPLLESLLLGWKDAGENEIGLRVPRGKEFRSNADV